MHTTPPGRSQCNFVQKEGQIRVQRAILAPVLAAKCKVVGLDFDFVAALSPRRRASAACEEILISMSFCSASARFSMLQCACARNHGKHLEISFARRVQRFIFPPAVTMAGFG